MPSPLFPDVPQALGVPDVLRDALNPATPPEPIARDLIEIDAANQAQWGVFDKDGALIVEPDNILNLDYSAESRIADYPVEQGSFESYDKVAMPFDIRVVMSKGGTLAERRDFLAKLEEIRGLLDLYNVVTPENTYLGVNIVRVSQIRSASNGAALMIVEVAMREVRVSATSVYTVAEEAVSEAPQPATPQPPMKPETTKNPGSSRKQARGSVQAKPKVKPFSAVEERKLVEAGKRTGLTVTFE